MTMSRGPLPTELEVVTSTSVIEHIFKVTARVNRHDEEIELMKADFLRVTGEVNRTSAAVVTQMNTLTDALRELRTAILPGGAMREKLITLPTIDVSEIQSVLDQKELEQRRRDSVRARDKEEEDRRIKLEDELALRRDARNSKWLLYITLGAAVLGEVARIFFTHSP